MEDLEKAFLQTFAKPFTATEKRALKQLLQQSQADDNTRAWLRNKFFDQVKHEMTDAHSLQLINWLEEVNKLLLTKTIPTSTDKVYFSPGEDCLEAILYQLKNAQHTIKICVFTISDDRITETILSCHRMGKKVYIITDNEKLYDTGSDIQRLEQAGIPIRIDHTTDHMHHKFAVIDRQRVLTGSYNWTRSAARYNHENILVTESQQAIASFETEFDKLWQSLDVL